MWQSYAGTPFFASFHASESRLKGVGVNTIWGSGLNKTVLTVPNPVSNCMQLRYRSIFQLWFQSYLVRIGCFLWPCTPVWRWLFPAYPLWTYKICLVIRRVVFNIIIQSHQLITKGWKNQNNPRIVINLTGKFKGGIGEQRVLLPISNESKNKIKV